MKNVFFIFLLFLFVQSDDDILYNHTNADKNLYFVFTTFRHGARFPFVREDHFGNSISSPGALTKYGALQHLEIGQKYRERYSNFLDMNFDKNQFYVRTTDVERTIISGEKQLEGLFNKTIGRKFFDIQGGGANFWNLYCIKKEERQELDKYRNYCKNKRSLGVDYNQIFQSEIFPILQNCFGIKNSPNIGGFCDSVYTAYFEYTFGNKTDNKIGKCGRENATKMNDFCYEWFNTFRGWDEYAAYMFYMLYQHMFDYMYKAINGVGPVKMVMLGGHDITVDQFMNFLSGLKIIPRTHYPHYACNIVGELRKYGDEFFLEFYYNDILKFNDTLEVFQSILENSKYSNLYNFCGLPPWIKINETKIKENDSQDTTDKIKNEINNIPTENKTNIESNQNKTNTEINKANTEYNQTTTEINKTNTEYNQTEINKTKDLNDMKATNGTLVNLKVKLKKFFKQDKDSDLFIILGSIIISIILLITIIILLILLYFKKRKKFTKLVEENQKNISNQLSLSESKK